MAFPFTLRLDAGCALGESPVWLAAEGRLAFVDITGRAVHLFEPNTGGHEVRAVGEDVGCIAPSTDGGMVAAFRSGIALIRADGSPGGRLAANPEDPATSRFNDGKVDPRGRLLVGTIDERRREGAAGLYRLDPGGLVRLKTGLLTSNGLAFSPDGRRLYHADTPRFTVFVHDYDPDSGDIGAGRVFVRLDPSSHDRARPDGAAVDVEGCYWSALWEGGRVERYDPDGRLMASYPVPARRPTMPAFGGADLKTLFVTSAADDGAAGGGLYAMEAPVAGLPVAAFSPTTAPPPQDRAASPPAPPVS